MNNLVFHGFHRRRNHIHLHPVLSLLLTGVGYLLVVVVAWLAVRSFVTWMWTFMPDPMLWGGGP
jgi:hypothetical protein